MTTMKKVTPAAPIAPWLGGKKALHKRIIERIDCIPHDTYVEPFVGMGGVFLRRSWVPKCEVANDINGEITNLFRVLQRHYPQLMEAMKFQIASRREFERLRESDPATLTDLERAARFLYLQRLAFGGRVGAGFRVQPGHAPSFSLAKIGPLLDAAHSRLDGVVFENLPWQDVLARWDSDKSLFYLDPPYWGGENDYGKGLFGRDEFTEMAEMCRQLKGAFVLSINDVPEIREIFAGFYLQGVQLTYTVSRSSSKAARELIVSNRDNGAVLI